MARRREAARFLAMPTKEQLEAIKNKRRAALLKKHTEGKRLTAEERSEIADLLDPQKKKPTEKEYAKTYKCDVRTIRRYKAAGFPLDDYEQMQEILNAQKHRPGQDESAPEGEITASEAKRRKMVVEWKLLAHRFDVEQKKYTLNTKIVEDLYAVGAAVGAALDILEADLPALLLGKDEIGMADLIRRETRNIRAMLADQTNRLYGHSP